MITNDAETMITNDVTFENFYEGTENTETIIASDTFGNLKELKP